MKDEMFGFYKNALLGSVTGTPICEDYKREWTQCGDDKDKLLKFALRQSCIPYLFLHSFNGQGLSKEYLLKEFRNYINGAYTVHDADKVKGYTYELNVARKGMFDTPNDVIAFMYCQETTVVIPTTKCSSLFVGCSSDVHISLAGYNSIRIYLYDNSRVVIEDADDESDVTVYRYSDMAKADKGKYCLCDVRVFDKDLRTQL